jgi:hypothetical protein
VRATERGNRPDAAGVEQFARAHHHLTTLDVRSLPPDVLSRIGSREDPDVRSLGVGLFDHHH